MKGPAGKRVQHRAGLGAGDAIREVAFAAVDQSGHSCIGAPAGAAEVAFVEQRHRAECLRFAPVRRQVVARVRLVLCTKLHGEERRVGLQRAAHARQSTQRGSVVRIVEHNPLIGGERPAQYAFALFGKLGKAQI